MRCEHHGEFRIRPRKRSERQREKPHYKVVIDTWHGDWVELMYEDDIEAARMTIGEIMMHRARKGKR